MLFFNIEKKFLYAILSGNQKPIGEFGLYL